MMCWYIMTHRAFYYYYYYYYYYFNRLVAAYIAFHIGLLVIQRPLLVGEEDCESKIM